MCFAPQSQQLNNTLHAVVVVAAFSRGAAVVGSDSVGADGYGGGGNGGSRPLAFGGRRALCDHCCRKHSQSALYFCAVPSYRSLIVSCVCVLLSPTSPHYNTQQLRCCPVAAVTTRCRGPTAIRHKLLMRLS